MIRIGVDILANKGSGQFKGGGDGPGPSPITTLIIDSQPSYNLSQLSSYPALETFIVIDTPVVGDIGAITNNNLMLFNLGDQGGNVSLTGNPLALLSNNSSLETLSIVGGDLSASSTTINSVSSNLEIYLEDNGLVTTDVDNIINSLSGNVFTSLALVGEDNETRSAASDAGVAQLTTDGVDLSLNVLPVSGLSFTNTGQTFTEEVAITPMVMNIAVGPGSDYYIETFGSLPSGLTFNTTQGSEQITGTIDAATAGDYNFIVRVNAQDDFTGYAEYEFNITVAEGGLAKPYTIRINVGNVGAAIAPADDGGNEWNNLHTLNGSIADLITENGDPTGIGFNMTGWVDMRGDYDGQSPNDGIYPNKAWRSRVQGVFNSDAIAYSNFTGLTDTDTLTFKVGASDKGTNDLKDIEHTIGGESIVKNAQDVPPTTADFTAKNSSGGAISIETKRATTGDQAGYVGFILLTVS